MEWACYSLCSQSYRRSYVWSSLYSIQTGMCFSHCRLPVIPSFSRASDQTDPVTHTDARHYTITAIFLFTVTWKFGWPFLKFQVGLQLLIILVIRCLVTLIILMINGVLWRIIACLEFLFSLTDFCLAMYKKESKWGLLNKQLIGFLFWKINTCIA